MELEATGINVVLLSAVIEIKLLIFVAVEFLCYVEFSGHLTVLVKLCICNSSATA